MTGRWLSLLRLDLLKGVFHKIIKAVPAAPKPVAPPLWLSGQLPASQKNSNSRDNGYGRDYGGGRGGGGRGGRGGSRGKYQNWCKMWMRPPKCPEWYPCVIISWRQFSIFKIMIIWMTCKKFCVKKKKKKKGSWHSVYKKNHSWYYAIYFTKKRNL